jgi:hypothetical protein
MLPLYNLVGLNVKEEFIDKLWGFNYFSAIKQPHFKVRYQQLQDLTGDMGNE